MPTFKDKEERYEYNKYKSFRTYLKEIIEYYSFIEPIEKSAAMEKVLFINLSSKEIESIEELEIVKSGKLKLENACLFYKVLLASNRNQDEILNIIQERNRDKK